jgi:RHS repeat-associated protein
MMPTIDDEASHGGDWLAPKGGCWPAEMGPRNPQASYYRARYYDLNVGRFISEDPIGFNGGNNFYAYVDNDPSDLSDPFGQCTPSPAMKECLEKIFSKPIDGVKIQEKPKKPDYPWAATTRRNKIIIFVPCDKFFGWNDVVLEEYFHVIEQWNTGRMNRRNYIWNDRHGHDKNKFEIEADDFAKKHLPDLESCLKCKSKAE